MLVRVLAFVVCLFVRPSVTLTRTGSKRLVVEIWAAKTRSPLVARMADRTAPVVKLTLTLNLTGHNLAKTGTSSLNRPIMRQNKAYRAIFAL